MRYNFETKWKRAKIEDLLNKYNMCFDPNAESNNSGCYTAIINKSRKIEVTVYKSTITVRRVGGYWKGITSYKKLDYVLNHFKTTN